MHPQRLSVRREWTSRGKVCGMFLVNGARQVDCTQRDDGGKADVGGLARWVGEEGRVKNCGARYTMKRVLRVRRAVS